MLVEVAAGFVPPCLDLKPFSLGLAVQGALLSCAFHIAIACGAFAGGPKVDDVPHSEGLDSGRMKL